MSFWLFFGLLEWYDYSWVSCLVLSCFSGFTLVYLCGTATSGCLVFVLSCLVGFTLVYLSGTTTAGCRVLSCLSGLTSTSWHLSGTTDYRQVRICECTCVPPYS